MEFVYDASKPLDGIIAHLTRECGGNIHRKGIVGEQGAMFTDLLNHPNMRLISARTPNSTPDLGVPSGYATTSKNSG